MAEHANSEIPTTDPRARERATRRAAARREQLRRRRRAGGAGVLAVIVGIVVLLALGGSDRKTGKGAHGGSATAAPKKKAIVPGGPLAPAALGGLAALWAPANVVGSQPGTAAAYEAASTRTGLPGYLMIADRGNNRILVVDPSGHVVFRYPRPGDPGLYYDDDTFVEPGGEYVIANEEDNHAIVQVGLRTHSLTVLFGQPGVPGADFTHVHTPDDAYMLPDGSFTVADASNCRILFIRARQIVRSYGHAGECHHDPPRYFTSVNGDTPVPGGGVMVSEIEGNWIDEIGPEGRLKWALQAPVGYPSDPQPLPGGRVLLADYSNPGHILIINRQGKVLWRYGPATGYGHLDQPSLAMPLPNGDVAVNDDYRHRVLIIDPRTNRIVWKYGHTDNPGTSAGQLNIPDGMDFVPAAADGSPDYAAVVHP
jgi:hypothetical protein